jgi:adenylate kinase family enzyme
VGRRGALTAYPPLGPRVVVGGISGTGKTTLAKQLAARLGAPHVELDAHFHLPGWEFASEERARATVGAAVAGERWVVDGNYAAVRDVVWSRATTLVWLDYRRGVGTWRAVRRTVPRIIRRHELWNGNREEWRSLLDKGHPVWWSWTQHAEHRRSYEASLADPAYAHLGVIRLRTPRETAEWLRYAAAP